MERRLARRARRGGPAHGDGGQSSRPSVALVLDPGKPPAVNGVDGISQKGARPGNASHYYSLTRMPTRGTIVVDGERFEVAGESWMDHEFGTSFLEPEQQGWDWLSIQLDDERELMLYQLRRADGTRDPRSSGTLVDAQGRHHAPGRCRVHARAGRRARTRASGAAYPVAWTIDHPARQTRARRRHAAREPGAGDDGRRRHLLGRPDRRRAARPRGRAVAGRGYLEMTGYKGSLGRVMSCLPVEYGMTAETPSRRRADGAPRRAPFAEARGSTTTCAALERAAGVYFLFFTTRPPCRR